MVSLHRLISDGQEGTFDMAFLDADKRKYGKLPMKYLYTTYVKRIYSQTLERPRSHTLKDLMYTGEYFNELLKLVRVGGIIVVDNILWYGRCADETVTDKVTVSMREFNQSLFRDDRISLSVLPVGDGLALCRKRSQV